MNKFVESFGENVPLSSMNRLVRLLKRLSDPSIESYLKQITTIDQAVCTWISLISRINFNVFKGFDNENDLVKYFLDDAFHDNYTVLASVVFTNVNFTDETLTANTIYKIRQNASLTPSTKRLRDRFWVPSSAQNGFIYYDFAFSWVQVTHFSFANRSLNKSFLKEMIDRAIIDTQVGRTVVERGLFFQEMPYPCYTYDKSTFFSFSRSINEWVNWSFLQMIQHALPLCWTISWVYAFAMLTQSIVYEKEVRLKEVMKIMGLSNGVQWVWWFLTIFSQTTLVRIAITLILHYGKVLMHFSFF